MRPFLYVVFRSFLVFLTGARRPRRRVRPRRGLLPLLSALLLATTVAWAQPAPDFARGVYYEIFVRSFQDSDGDGIGDLQGVRDRLPYLEQLGVRGIWLMPIHPSPSYHGYDVTDYFAIHPDYGTLADFEELVDDAHARGIRIVIDLVINHTSNRHPWFRAALAGDPRYRDYYLWSDQPLPWTGAGGGNAWHRAGGAYYLGQFVAEMPDLNHRNPAVAAEVERITAFWLERGVDGFRVDAIQHIVESVDGVTRNAAENFAWVAEFERRLHALDERAFIVGETWTDTPTIVRYHTEADLDMSFDYPLWETLIDAVRRRSPSDLAFMLEQNARLYPPDAQRGIFLANHDQVRPATSLAFLRPDPARLRLAAGLLLTLPGTPFLYYGEEIGMPNGDGAFDLGKRTPMRWTDGPGSGFTDGVPWQPFSTDDAAVTVAAQAEDPDSLLSYYRRLIGLRNGSEALTAGGFELRDAGNDRVLAFERMAAGERLLVLANFHNGDTTLALAPLGAEGAQELLTGTAVAAEITLGKLELRILRLPQP